MNTVEPDKDRQRLAAAITGARAGNQECYREILAYYGPRLYGYFFRATGLHHEAEDLLAEVMLRLVRMLSAYDDRGRFEPWLFRIAANLLRDRIRRGRTHPASASLDADSADGAALTDGLQGKAVSVDARLLGQEIGASVQHALERLDERSRQMVLLRHFAQLSFKEIAEIFDCPVGTVLAKVHRALKAMRATLEANDEHA